jgi:hypothetical protein
MSCSNNNCGCSPSGYPTPNNECCTDVAEYTRFAYSSAQSAYANAQNAEQSAEDAATTLANVVQKTGDTMTGLLVLSGDPLVALGASTKQYTDTRVLRSGDTMTGFLTLNAAPTSNLHATTKLYTDTADALKVSKAGDSMSGALVVNNTITGNTIVSNGNILASGNILSSSSSNGIGYNNGAGASVTQLVSRTTGVLINANCGTIKLFYTNGSATYASFIVTNSSVAATDTIILNQQSGTDLYELNVTFVTNGSFRITFRTTGGTTLEEPIFNFAVIKAVNI